MSCLKNNLLPLFEFINGNVFDEEIVEFVKTYRQLIMKYVLFSAEIAIITKYYWIDCWLPYNLQLLHEYHVFRAP